MMPHRAAKLARALVDRMPSQIATAIDVVVSPAMGGIILGQEVARVLDLPHMFLERPTGTFEFRRGFRLFDGDKVLLVEDVVTTGLSSRESIDVIEAGDNKVIAVASLVDRSSGTVDFSVPYFSLLQLDIPVYKDDEVPADLAAIPITKPGSRSD
jgi:orotate phosphoribosyltransferase